MRKLWIIFVVSVLSLTIAKAQATSAQAPIIAYVDYKLYRVSPDDGSSKVLVETDNLISPIHEGNLSPDSKQLAYVTYKPTSADKNAEPQGSDLFVVTLADGSIEKITPSGGLFDAPAPKGQVYDVDAPVWSLDGQRIYYFRTPYDFIHKQTAGALQLAYYDVAAHKHQLVARIDPKTIIDGLQAVKDGIVLKWRERSADTLINGTLYRLDNQAVKQPSGDIFYGNALHDTDGDYLARLRVYGDIETMVNVATGAEKQPQEGSFPAVQGLMNGDQSMHILNFQSNPLTNSVYGADYDSYITDIDSELGGEFAIAPDGQTVAYLQYGSDNQSPIHIIDIIGNVHELDFKAAQIVWGAVQYAPFLIPG